MQPCTASRQKNVLRSPAAKQGGNRRAGMCAVGGSGNGLSNMINGNGTTEVLDGNVDTVQIGTGVAPGERLASRARNELILKIAGTTEQIPVFEKLRRENDNKEGRIDRANEVSCALRTVAANDTDWKVSA